MTPMCIRFMINHKKDPYETTRIQWNVRNRVFFHGSPHLIHCRMPGTDRSDFASAADCQRHCASVKGCHLVFTWYPQELPWIFKNVVWER